MSIRRGDLTVWISGPRTAAHGHAGRRQRAPGSRNRIVLQVQDLRATVDSLRDAGVTFRNDIVTGLGGKQWSRTRPATPSNSSNPTSLVGEGQARWPHAAAFQSAS